MWFFCHQAIPIWDLSRVPLTHKHPKSLWLLVFFKAFQRFLRVVHVSHIMSLTLHSPSWCLQDPIFVQGPFASELPIPGALEVLKLHWSPQCVPSTMIHSTYMRKVGDSSHFFFHMENKDILFCSLMTYRGTRQRQRQGEREKQEGRKKRSFRF